MALGPWKGTLLRAGFARLWLLSLGLAGCAAFAPQPGSDGAAGGHGASPATLPANIARPSTAEHAIVHCLLPGTVRRLGPFHQSLSPRRAERLPASACEEGGGEYVTAQSEPAAALKLWLSFAQSGDAQAQLSLGELLEQASLLRGEEPLAALAAQWYEKAANQGQARAAINLAAMHQSGWGVRREPARALALMQQALVPRLEGEAAATRPTPPAELAAAPPQAHSARTAPLERSRYALLIANQNYAHWPNLQTPSADARALANLLWQAYGFEVQVLQDSTRTQLLAALASLRAKADAQDEVLIFYAGHGELDRANGRGYWIPVDGDTRESGQVAQWVSVADITDQLAAMRARQVLVIADSCYSGTLSLPSVPALDLAAIPGASVNSALTMRGSAATVVQGQPPSAGPFALTPGQRRSRMALSSGGLEPVPDSAGGPHSLFALSLMHVLSQVQIPTSGQRFFVELAAQLEHRLQANGLRQRPMYAPIAFAGHEAGDFVFAPQATMAHAP